MEELLEERKRGSPCHSFLGVEKSVDILIQPIEIGV